MRFTGYRFWGRAFSALWACSVAVLPAHAQAPERIYRCGKEYTNIPAQTQNCQVVQGQNVTEIQGTRPFGASAGPGALPLAGRTKTDPSATLGAPSLGLSSPGPVEAKFRDAQQRAILVAELQQTRERHSQLVLDYNAGEPDLLGSEARNHQKYLDRLVRLKAGIARAERDMDSLQRELSRLPSNQVAQP